MQGRWVWEAIEFLFLHDSMQLPAILLPLTGNLIMCQVWDYRRSAEMRDTEGGASKRSVLQQAEKLKSYLEQEGLD